VGKKICVLLHTLCHRFVANLERLKSNDGFEILRRARDGGLGNDDQIYKKIEILLKEFRGIS